MKRTFLLLICLLQFSFVAISQSNCDYIKSGYYQLINEADIALLSDNNELAYQKITEAEKLCPLVEQSYFQTISWYIDLLVERGEFDKALQYATTLVRDYGYSVNIFEKNEKILSENVDWDSEKRRLTELNKEFYNKVDTNLVKEIKAMCVSDQEVRKQWR